ncbi:MAG TPA: DinB family protein [Terriglobales bacterium]|nr:DinB family protein [Terriglobales bacterium]
MKSYKTIAVLVSICCVFGTSALAQAGSSGSAASAQAPTAAPTITSVLNNSLRSIEREVMNAAEAVPQDKFDFSPGTANIPGDFKTPNPVRTMAEQFKHIGDALESYAAGIMGQKPQASSDENGPKNIKTKQEVIDYLKAAFAKAHSAIDTVNQQNATEEIANPFGGSRKVTRLALAVGMVGHSNNHYGQIIEYLRMNSIVPPESQRSR